ncbi:MAG: hypothetical protein CME43_00490 [Haliea sp.]|jgi:hypothetical protein|uniref:hypothetical protein n=1 Tax=Haliea sp. TaxID=1932666 RepID=UPI000C3787C6|nr:hypothetical protein [Haliea sp.]MBM67943.1 hypothetical protein [Haliea sp.]|tara:strand:+ start:1550 stop:2509 length:960 start_codon:yes stop_codon:yes gene_type:complete
MEEEKYIGYIKYEGELVDDGLMDARRQAKSLLAFDSALRYFITKQAPDFRNLDFEIPVRIRKGSWEALIPETVAGWVQAGLGVVATAYFTKAAQKMAEKDFADFGITDLFKTAIESIKWFARIGKHMGDVAIRQFKDVQFSDDRALVGIANAEGKILFVPKDILDLYVATNPRLLEDLAANVQAGRTLAIGSVKNGEIDEEIVGPNEKNIFCDDDEEIDDDVLFPELVHGDYVVLDGEVTRENKTSNSMGFKYNEHILTSYPETGSIVRYKPLLFLKCRLFGTVDRIDEKGRIGARRPKLYFSSLEPLEDDTGNEELFE